MTDPNAAMWAALLPVLEELRALEVPYYVGGSVASSYTGLARATQDADVVADLRIVHALPFVHALQDRYYCSQESVLNAIRAKKSFNLVHFKTAFKIDIFILAEEAFARQAMARRVVFEVPGLARSVDLCSPEDIVLNKLRWYVMGNRVSDRQWNDIQGILRLRGNELDLSYLRRWARTLDLESDLSAALRACGLGES